MTTTCSELDIPRNPRYRSLDMWRGMACLMIVLIHASNGLYREEANSGQSAGRIGSLVTLLLLRMGVGVTIFFVISGYCIAATADSSRRKPRGYLQYFLRRLRRIFPPYWAILLLSIVLVLLAGLTGWQSIFSDGSGRIPQPASLSIAQWLGNISLTEAWRYHLSGNADSRLLLFGPGWSLCYEEQFYMVCGILLLLAPRRFFGGIALVTLFTLVMIARSFPYTPQSLQYFFFDGRWLLFAAGVLVYYILNYATGSRRNILVAALAGSALTAAVVRYGLLSRIGDEEQKQRMYEYIVGSGFALLLLALQPWDERIASSQFLRPINFCGKLCYSLYLIHWPVTIVITHSLYQAGIKQAWPTLLFVVPLATLASVAAAWLFYQLVERHFINPPATSLRRERSENVPRAVVPALVETPAAATPLLTEV